MAIPTPAQIRAAVADLGVTDPPWAERYRLGGQLLLLGGWAAHAQFLLFPGGITAQHDGCTCQEGRGPVVCAHRIALTVLEHASGWPAAAMEVR